MAPPSKRRKLFFWTMEESENGTESTATLPVFEHKVDQLDSSNTAPSLESSDGLSDKYDFGTPELRLQQRRDLVLRQDTVVTSPVVVHADVIVSVEVAVSAATSTPSTTTAAVSTSSDPVPTPAQGVSQSALITATATSVPLTVSSVPSALASSVLSSTSAADSSTISTSLATVSTAYLSTSSSISKNITVAGDILTSNLTLSTSSSRLTGIFPTSYANSSFSLNATTSSYSTVASASSGSISISTDTSNTLTTYTTTGADGQPSTITTAVGAPIYTTPASPPPSDVPYSGGSSPGPPPAGTIAGGVVGGAAGLAVLLLVAMLFVRWYRQRSKRENQSLLPDSNPDSESAHFVSHQPGMAESAGARPLISAFPLLTRHQQSPSGRSRPTRGLSVGNERGFQRLSGRKLPSAFSPGMENTQQQQQQQQQPPPPLPFTGQVRDSAASSVYPPTPVVPSNPFEVRPGSTSPEDGSALSRQISDEQMTMLPGPQRRPTIHNTHANLHVPGASTHTRHVSSSARTSGLLH